MDNVNDENCDVTQGGASCAQVGEGLVPWCINDQETRNLVFFEIGLSKDLSLLFNPIDWEEGGTNLLGDTAGFTLLHVGLSNLSSLQYRNTNL